MSNQLRKASPMPLGVAEIRAHADRMAGMLVPPFSYERIDSKTDGVNFRIADGRDDRIATCYEETHARAIVASLNQLLPLKT